MEKSELKEMLSMDVHTVTFKKVDGTIRVMDCTLNPEYIPPAPVSDKPARAQSAENPEVLRVYEVNNGWRSFRVASVESIVRTETV